MTRYDLGACLCLGSISVLLVSLAVIAVLMF
jgi:hypothetical protein